MDLKKIGMIVGGSLGSFVIIFAAMYFLFPYLNPQKKKQVATQQPKMEEARFDPDKYGPAAVRSYKKQIKKLQQMVDSLEAEGKNYLAQIDSLKEKNKQAKQHNEKLVTKMPEKVTKKSIGEDVSKSLLNLDQEALSPIVNLLDDEQLVGLYNSASNMQRAKLLRSLKPEKAATVLKKVM